MHRLPLLFAVAGAWLSAGCALTTVHIEPPPIHTDATGAKHGRGREVIVVAPFDDARPEDRCGMQMNGYRMDTADVVCDVPPGRWLSDAFAAALSRDGYRVLRSDAVATPSTIRVRGWVTKLFLEPHDTFARTVEADFSVRLEVSTASGLKAERTFYVKGKKPDLASTEAVFQAAADDATRRIALAMTEALGELLDRYPELGAPPPPEAVATNANGNGNTR